MNLKELRKKLQICTMYFKLLNEFVTEKGLKEEFNAYCEKRLGKEKVENDKKNLV